MTITYYNKDIIVFSHLRWEFVWQRPQHIISRLAKKHRIFFIEEPIEYEPDNEKTFRSYTAAENITVLQPRIHNENLIEDLYPMLNTFMQDHEIDNPYLWFYSPMFKPLLKYIPHSFVIYDCMDQLAAFKGAPPSLLRNEKELLARADVVFTGGKSLYEEKKSYNENVHCFPSSVERNHFEQALLMRTKIPQDMADIVKPIVGFYGVLDERLDTKLLGDVARRMPQVSFVLLGPIVKINPDDLPQNANIHYLGPKNYQELPNYLKAFDIAMMPFALNRSTKFISPTKTLEYMAALKPIVSTPIYDVVRDYSNEVAIAKTAGQFEKAIKQYLDETSLERKNRETKMSTVIDNTSWDKTVSAMEEIMKETVDQLAIIDGDIKSDTTYPATYSL